MATVRERIREKREEKKKRRTRFIEETASALAGAYADRARSRRPPLHELGGADRSIPGNTTASQTHGWSTLLGLFRDHQQVPAEQVGVFRQVTRDGKTTYEQVRPRRSSRRE